MRSASPVLPPAPRRRRSARVDGFLGGLLLWTIGAGSGCGPLSPDVQRTNAYLKTLQPLLVENGHLAERVLVLAAKTYNKDGDSDALAEGWTSEVVPLAEHLHHQSQGIDAPLLWAEPHAELVESWGERALVYRSLSEALVLGDAQQWAGARKKATEATLAEAVTDVSFEETVNFSERRTIEFSDRVLDESVQVFSHAPGSSRSRASVPSFVKRRRPSLSGSRRPTGAIPGTAAAAARSSECITSSGHMPRGLCSATTT